MTDVNVQLFQLTDDDTEVRFFGPDGRPSDSHLLDHAALAEAIRETETVYQQHVHPTRQQLLELGMSLYELLDGSGRLLTQSLGAGHGTLHIETGERFRHLPWELIADNDKFLAVNSNRPLHIVRRPGSGSSDSGSQANRPLRVLFMASSPEDVKPVLNYEAEEAQILRAAQLAGIELVVEERGSLAGLQQTIASYGVGYFDVLHLSGHATVNADDVPVFVFEDDFGAREDATSEALVDVLQHRWPRLLFLSGCRTGQATNEGDGSSMAERLVQAGAPAVLGWALPVGDLAASVLAAALYEQLANGGETTEAVWGARYGLFKSGSNFWHYLRMYADQSRLGPMVTPLATAHRSLPPVRAASEHFLDPLTRQVRVASNEEYVGRRRLLQRALRHLTRPIGSPDAVAGLALTGMGGLGKSTTASRILDRMPNHGRLVHIGAIDGDGLRKLINKAGFRDTASREEANKILSADLSWEHRLTHLLNQGGPLATEPHVFVFDDFEAGNLDKTGSGYRLSAEAAEIIPALLNAIQATGSQSRVIVTSRYEFETPTSARLEFVAVGTLSDVDQMKKLSQLSHLNPNRAASSTIAPEAVRDRAVQAAAGNPRLMERLNRLLAAPGLDVHEAISKIEETAEEFRDEVLAAYLLGLLPDEMRAVLAQINLVELPIPRQVVAAMADVLDNRPDIDKTIARSGQLGLLEVGAEPQTREPQYYVSNVLTELLADELTEAQTTSSYAAAARALYQVWFNE